MHTIDFVITWVDSNDPSWLRSKEEYEMIEYASYNHDSLSRRQEDNNSACRYRELGFLKYWFRSIEEFTPWVNKVYFVTCGQKPEWLNENHPKLVMVNHKDFIPERYLPTFNSNTIEMNLHRIDGLSEHFVLFNDDMFLLRPVKPSFFFKDKEPVLMSSLRYPLYPHLNAINRIKFNNYVLINGHFNTKKSIWRSRSKWFNIKELGLNRVRRNFLCYLANGTIPVGQYGHLPLPHLRSSFEDLWSCFPDIMEETSKYRFRSDFQINQWVLCAWNQANGCFYPADEKKLGCHIDISPDSIEWIEDVIKKQLYPQICANDTRYNLDSQNCADRIITAFEAILPHKSSYEI